MEVNDEDIESDDSMEEEKMPPREKWQSAPKGGKEAMKGPAKTGKSPPKSKHGASNGNIMDTNWGADVFGIVDHDLELDDDSDDDDNDVDRSDVKKFSPPPSSKHGDGETSYSSSPLPLSSCSIPIVASSGAWSGQHQHGLSHNQIE